jgi:alkanesulfonate monooxygenase SsuD/methylene tetrahydromethanopterin reductase-like flavin-dependent oxidoreductase (luciferase family)
MKLGIGLPATIPNTPRELVLDWAKRADERGFSSLGITDRLVYPNLEPLITLAAVSSVTKRVRLMTTVLIAPIRNTAFLAKEAATLDRLSGGRLSLGLGIGGREDDSLAAGIQHKSRSKRFEGQIRLMRKIWAGETLSDRVGKIGPSPTRKGGPEVLIGGYTPVAAARAGRLGDGYIAGGGLDAKAAVSFYKTAEDAWKKAGREGKPRFVCSAYYALGPNAADKGSTYIRDYYAFMGSSAENVAKRVLSTPVDVENAVKSFSENGADELILWPTIAELEQVELASKYLK